MKMTRHRIILNRAAAIATCLILGCSGGGTFGCGSSGGGGDPVVDSGLPGVYEVNNYQGTAEDDTAPDVCERLTGIEPIPGFIVLYSFRPNDEPDSARLGGIFCGSVEQCQQDAAQAPQPAVGFSFRQGNDQSGWLGWGVGETGSSGDQCRAEVQQHTLTSPSSGAIRIDTEVFETVFAPALDGNQATCSVRDAIESLNPSVPCAAAFLVEATRAADL